MTTSSRASGPPSGPGPVGIPPTHRTGPLAGGTPGPPQDHSRTRTTGPERTFRGCVRIHAYTCELVIHSPRSANTIIKALPKGERIWDDETRSWRAQKQHLNSLVLALTLAGYSVRTLTPDQPAPAVQLRTRQIQGAW